MVDFRRGCCDGEGWVRLTTLRMVQQMSRKKSGYLNGICEKL